MTIRTIGASEMGKLIVVRRPYSLSALPLIRQCEWIARNLPLRVQKLETVDRAVGAMLGLSRPPKAVIAPSDCFYVGHAAHVGKW